MRIDRELARREGVEMEEIPIDRAIKLVNIYLSTTFSEKGRQLLAKELMAYITPEPFVLYNFRKRPNPRPFNDDLQFSFTQPDEEDQFE